MPTQKIDSLYHSLTRLIHAQESESARQHEFLQNQLGNYTLTQLHILSCINEGELTNNRTLTDTLGLTRAAISKAVNRLIQDGMITTYQIPDNQKSVFYQLTTAGAKLAIEHEVLHHHAEAQYRAFLQKFDEETLTQAHYFIEELILFLAQKEHLHD